MDGAGNELGAGHIPLKEFHDLLKQRLPSLDHRHCADTVLFHVEGSHYLVHLPGG
jgi:hypothetical protein